MRIILNCIVNGINSVMTFIHLNTLFLKLKLKGERFQSRFVRSLYLICFVFAGAASANNNPEDLRQLLQLTEYIGVDYSAAIKEGKVIDQGEFQEMLEFSNIIAEKSATILGGEQPIATLSQSLQIAVQEKQPTEIIQSITTKLKTRLLKNSPQLSLPKSLLSLSEVKLLFQNECSSCHGLSGQGDGVLAKQLVPEPTNFSDRERALNRSVLGLFDVISGGLEGTAMPAFNQLNSKQRWSLAFYAGSFAFTSDLEQNETEAADVSPQTLSLANIVMFSPNELIQNNSNTQLDIIEQLRADPAALFTQTESPLTITHNQLEKARSAYQQNDFVNAKRFAVSAYLDGFELVENSLDGYDQTLRKDIESKLLGLRQALNDKTNASQVERSVSDIFVLLEKAQRLLTESSMSNATLFSASFIILLREGLEALLVVIALFTVLVRSNKKEAIRYVHIGWGAALVVGILTWVVAQYLVTISGASREIMEGVAAMLAAVVLFYVGFWMHSKTQADQWQLYIQQNIDRSLKTGTLWGISGLAFIAVYREVFETVLFYQSLLTQTTASQELVLVAGFGAAVFVLVLIAGLIVKYSVKLPISRFFSTTTFLLLALSFILAGKAISALQEAALIGISSMPVDFQIDWLGVNSTWQGVGMQLTILVLSIALIFKPWFKLKFGQQKTMFVDEQH